MGMGQEVATRNEAGSRERTAGTTSGKRVNEQDGGRKEIKGPSLGLSRLAKPRLAPRPPVKVPLLPGPR